MTQQYVLATQVAISCSSLAFAMVMLYRGKDPGVYLPIVTGIVGCWLPSPQSIKAASALDALAAPSSTTHASDIERPLLK